MDVRARARLQRCSASKVRPLLVLIRNRPVGEALAVLRYLPQPRARQVAKLVRSAVANAENNHQMAAAGLQVVQAFADEGPTLKRHRAAPRGRVRPILKRTAHITIVVGEGR